MKPQFQCAADLLDELVDVDRPKIDAPVMVVVAHPDDETIGIGAQLSRMNSLSLVHVTNGAPEDGRDAQQAGYLNARDYARARRIELMDCFAVSGISPERSIELQIQDQTAAFHLVAITRALRTAIARRMPSVIFTHSYEGGHPDHDATAFCAHRACRGLKTPPQIIEMPFYHCEGDLAVMGRFLHAQQENGADNLGQKIWTAYLRQEEVLMKERMFSCFRTQQRVLSAFPLHSESFRLAPHYDFSLTPHPGILHYEKLPFKMDGRRFCQLTCEAIRSGEI